MRHGVRIEGRHVSYRDEGPGDGRVVLLLHAFPLTSDMWRPQLETPPAGWRLIAPDLAGLGRSDDTDTDPPTLDDYAADAIEMLNRLAIERAVIAGVSLGGYVALACARRAPQRIAGLILADTKAAADTPQAREGRQRMLDVLDDKGVAGVADTMLTNLIGDSTKATRGMVVEDVRTIILTNQSAGVRRAIIRLRDRPDATPGLAQIAVPAVVVRGAEDGISLPADADVLVNGIRGATLETIPAAGHLSSLENPEAFNRVMSDFLGRV